MKGRKVMRGWQHHAIMEVEIKNKALLWGDGVMAKFTNIDEYISACPVEMWPKLEQMRSILHEALPEAVECISYSMPAFRMKTVLLYFAAGKNHIGFYPTAEPITHFSEELKCYHPSKGAIRFPADQPLPEDLIRTIAQYRYAHAQSKAKDDTGGHI